MEKCRFRLCQFIWLKNEHFMYFCSLKGFQFDCLCAAPLTHHMVLFTFNYDNIKVFVLHSPFM